MKTKAKLTPRKRKQWGATGGRTAASRMTQAGRTERARRAAQARWANAVTLDGPD